MQIFTLVPVFYGLCRTHFSCLTHLMCSYHLPFWKCCEINVEIAMLKRMCNENIQSSFNHKTWKFEICWNEHYVTVWFPLHQIFDRIRIIKIKTVIVNEDNRLIFCYMVSMVDIPCVYLKGKLGLFVGNFCIDHLHVTDFFQI